MTVQSSVLITVPSIGLGPQIATLGPSTRPLKMALKMALALKSSMTYIANMALAFNKSSQNGPQLPTDFQNGSQNCTKQHRKVP